MLPNAVRSLALLALATLLGCATLRPIELDEPFELEPDDGILLVDVISNVPLHDVSIDRPLASALHVGQLQAGHHQRLFAAPAGNYSWAQVNFNPWLAFRMLLDEYWTFRIEPGQINYPGTLIVRKASPLASTSRSYVLNLNRSASSYKLLEKPFPNLLEQYRIEYTGRDRDDFLIRYQEAQRTLRTPDTSSGLEDAEASADDTTRRGEP